MSMYDLDEFAIKPFSRISVSSQTNPTSSGHNKPDPHSGQTAPVSTRAQNLMTQFHDYTQHNNPTPPTSADEGHHYFDCPKVWERIVTHPRFDEVDVEVLCAELNSKVKIVYPPTH